MSKKSGYAVSYFKNKYDYIIVDTGSCSLVADTLVDSKHADTFLYVARANF
jgi:Mrp family chromosome partitioning ATPase